MPQRRRASVVREYYRRAAQAKSLAEAASDPDEKEDLLAVERKWLELAQRVGENENTSEAGW